jgi:ribosomal protein S12 methylthiotransferase accessory factor
MLLDGRRSIGEVAGELAGEFSLVDVMLALFRLEEQGHVVEAAPNLAPSVAAFWSALDQQPANVAAVLATLQADVYVSGLNQSIGPLFGEELAALGLRRDATNATAAITVALVDDYQSLSLATVNARSLAERRPLMLVRPVGRSVWIGPLLRPGQTGCWQCLVHRLEGNHPIEHLARGHAIATPQVGSSAYLPTTLSLALHLAATAVSQAVVTPPPSPLDGRLLSFDLGTLETTWHVLVRWPQCPACGSLSRPEEIPASFALERRPWLASGTMGHRASPPEETLRRYGHHHTRITGIVPLLQRATPVDDTVIHTYSSRHSAFTLPSNLSSLQDYLQNTNGGKGTTDLQAGVSALAESLERFSGSFQGNERRHRARIAELGDQAIHPATYLLYSERQYAERDAWNARRLRFQDVPRPFDEERELDWTPLWSLTRREVRYLPTALCYYRFRPPPDEDIGGADSNGCAAGNSREEAILQGLLELVERDSTALFWYNRVCRPEIDLETVDDSYVQQLIRNYEARGREVWALDLTSDLGIPVVAGCSRYISGGPEEILIAFGAHLDPLIAIRRALTEMNQLLPALDQTAKQIRASEPKPSSQLDEWLTTATLANQPYLLPADGPPNTLSKIPNIAQGDLREEIERCQALLEGRGLELLVLDQTRAEVGMPVMRVVVPGLRYVWARFAPGRLYGVPVQLGWLPKTRTESELNTYYLPL